MFEKIEKYKSSINNIRQLIYQENRLNHVTLDDTKIHMQVQSNEFVFQVSFKVDSSIVNDKIVYSISLNLPFDFEDFNDQTNQPIEAFWELKHRAWVTLYSNLKKIESKNKPDHDVENILKDIMKKYDSKPEDKQENIESIISNLSTISIINSNDSLKTYKPVHFELTQSGDDAFSQLVNDTVSTGKLEQTLTASVLTSGHSTITDSVSSMRSEIVEELQNLNSSIKELVQEIKLEREKPSLLKRFIRRFVK